jgi:hypothetical protein
VHRQCRIELAEELFARVLVDGAFGEHITYYRINIGRP